MPLRQCLTVRGREHVRNLPDWPVCLWPREFRLQHVQARLHIQGQLDFMHGLWRGHLWGVCWSGHLHIVPHWPVLEQEGVQILHKLPGWLLQRRRGQQEVHSLPHWLLPVGPRNDELHEVCQGDVCQGQGQRRVHPQTTARQADQDANTTKTHC